MRLFPDLKTFMEIEIGSFHLRIAWYAILIVTGAIIAYRMSLRNAKKIGYGKELLEDYFLMMMPLAILGARVWYVMFDWASFASEPIRIFYIWEGGLAIHGGLITGIIFSYFFFRSKGANLLRIGDCIMPNVLIAQAIGRWGNFMNQEAYGGIVNEEYFRMFPSFIKDTMYIDSAYRQPMFLIEGIGNIIGFILIITLFKRFIRKKNGDMIFAYVIWYGIIRFIVEIYRTDALYAGSLKIAQVTSIVFILVGLLGLAGVFDRLFKNIYPFKKEKPVVLFDADGTLIDTQKLIFDSFRHTFATLKPEVQLTDEELLLFMGPPLYESLAKYFDESEVDKALEVYRDFNHGRHDEYVKAVNHAKELLDYLKENGYEIGVVSSKMHWLVDKGLIQSGLADYFDVVVGREDVTHFKPNPEPLLIACKEMRVPHDNLIYVGDATSDVQAAQNMGAVSIAFVNDPRMKEALIKTKPSYMVYDLIEIIEIVKEDRTWNELVM
ncbi:MULTISPECIES: prolipoprotein diacylglyceryl transferase [unclassified Breznakia]|uniref:prolipoprotein diacylglyceryl transferase n=1 Tax=unclassified Breznakia TaxID=2623764 RepID=UPI0024734F72|nr:MULTISPECIES: prolipoprotein diacylglyceryl transferase [unclassified Breznakia]MDH6366513.1 phosphatidylglycerol:prolipoprotein diacylglycerol transferase [Breznakia sp. PH1-1]MDH6403606.1 phosphatidylglycerol:prolipoprotein diacylglycerol transferase [Breznakia sp. PF1-11]MDH6411315.1 phosphatidylglycerol:prolipoprotein diacylglycerol transferase [Breznakia sp. PFB1-11]MDH6413709.1 phosphatidylglycerol:prolipoprotein diacylglycerol transferase [Breznakia sp. PFB1-14]MDH6415860.1 phosphati